jgi:benzaldehyde dehydrogenase (NAD)
VAEILDSLDWQGKIFSSGWVSSHGGVLDSTEPATGDVLAQVGLADASNIEVAAAAAKNAQPEWAAQPGPQRAALLRRAACVLEDDRAEFEQWLVREGGAIPGKAAFEVDLVLGELWEAAALPTQPWGHLLPTSEAGRQSIARRVPLGVVGVISPWNFPQILSVRAVAPALALGNAVVLKPDVQTAVSGGVLIARLFELAGLPEGLLHVLPGDAEPGTALTANPDVAMISFTGSTAVGRLVGEAAGRTLKRVSLELGGNNALIVLDDADLDVASSAGAWSAFLHQGQVCMTAGRHIVVESVADSRRNRGDSRSHQYRDHRHQDRGHRRVLRNARLARDSDCVDARQRHPGLHAIRPGRSSERRAPNTTPTSLCDELYRRGGRHPGSGEATPTRRQVSKNPGATLISARAGFRADRSWMAMLSVQNPSKVNT